MKFCPECGAKVEGMKFCPECGYKLDTQNGATSKMDNSDAAENDETVVLTFQNKALIGDVNAKKNLIGNLDVKVPHKNYTLTSHRLIIESHGVLKTNREEIDLYRINDVVVKQSIIEKTRNVGTIRIISTDPTTPDHALESIENPQEVSETIKTIARKAKEKLNISYRQNI